MKLIDGKKISDQIKEEIAAEVEQIKAKGGKIPHLAAILVGNDGGKSTFTVVDMRNNAKIPNVLHTSFIRNTKVRNMIKIMELK